MYVNMYELNNVIRNETPAVLSTGCFIQPQNQNVNPLFYTKIFYYLLSFQNSLQTYAVQLLSIVGSIESRSNLVYLMCCYRFYAIAFLFVLILDNILMVQQQTFPILIFSSYQKIICSVYQQLLPNTTVSPRHYKTQKLNVSNILH